MKRQHVLAIGTILMISTGCTVLSRRPTTGAYGCRDVGGIRIGGDYEQAITEYRQGRIDPRLKAPIPVYPPDRTVFGHYPRTIDYAWRPAEGTPKDARYLVQTEFTWKGEYTSFGDWDDQTRGMLTYVTGKTTMSDRFMGAQPGRWRVKVTCNGGESEWFAWQYFRFTR